MSLSLAVGMGLCLSELAVSAPTKSVLRIFERQTTRSCCGVNIRSPSALAVNNSHNCQSEESNGPMCSDEVHKIRVIRAHSIEFTNKRM